MGPLLISRILQLNETQEGVLTIAFKVADENGLLLLDLKDLQSLLQFVGENADELTLKYGNVSKASVGAIQRGLLQLEQQGGDAILWRTGGEARGFYADARRQRRAQHLLAADDLINSPKLYSTFLLWLLSELFEMLPEAGDLDKPKLVFFFDEAHLLFNDAPTVARRKDRAGRSLDPFKRCRRLFCYAEPGGYSRQGSCPTRQSRAARTSRLHAEGAGSA